MATNTNDNLKVKLAFSRDGEKYICFICKGLMIDACQTVNCGHHFCKHCLDHLYDEEYVNYFNGDFRQIDLYSYIFQSG